ncbi:MAG: FHA domain-containing protein [Chloroflexota bacterium]
MQWIRAWWTRWLGFVVCLAMSSVGLLLAQTDTDNTRIISVYITDGTQLNVQVAVPAGMTVESVTVALPDDTLTLRQRDISFVEERWILLDGGRDMLNAESEIRDELGALLSDDDFARRTGLIIFQDDSEPQIVAPSDDSEIVRDAIATYQASASRVGCVREAVSAFNRYQENTLDVSAVRRVLLITGSTSCDDDLPTVTVPVDILVLGSANGQLIGIAEQGNTVIRTSNLPTFDGALAEVLSRWQTDILLYETTLSGDIASATVTLSLTDGQTLSRTVPVTGVFDEPSTPTPVPSPTETQTPMPTTTIEATEDLTSAEATDEVALVVPEDSENEASESTIEPLMDQDDILNMVVILLFATVTIGSALFAQRMRQRKMAKVLESFDTRMESTQQIALAYLRDTDKTNVYAVFIPATILGRGGKSTLIIKDDKLSREHVRFTETEQHGLLMTRLSQAEVLVNGDPVERAQQLFVGDIITLSPNTSLLVERIDDDV